MLAMLGPGSGETLPKAGVSTEVARSITLKVSPRIEMQASKVNAEPVDASERTGGGLPSMMSISICTPELRLNV